MCIFMSMSPLPTVLDRKTVPLVTGLASHGDRVALQTPGGPLTYAQLADRVGAMATRLGPERRLVQVAGGNDIASLVAYLGALAAGCPVLLVPPGEDAWRAAYDPDVVLAGEQVLERRVKTAHVLHPELALLLPTSGTTGSPRLVRLSHANLQAAAESVAQALGVRPDDRAATTLPLHYCYGLSVVHSHLLRGATLVLTSLSVADTCFWDLVRREGVTTFAGVPYTFDLLDRVGFAELDLPCLRYVTQAGGRLAPDRVQRWAEVGRRRGWDLVVMYGQTEATARMAVLPAELAASRPGSVGRAVPGGELRVEPVDGVPGPVGELIYRGPNVMLGYADQPADLAQGRTTGELRTGDLGRIGPDGLIEVVGRRSRIAKVLGTRVDLVHLESVLATQGCEIACVDGGDVLLAAAVGQGDDAVLRDVVARAAGLPVRAVRAAHVCELPRLPSGKPDLRVVATLVPAPPAPVRTPAHTPLDRSLVALYTEVLDRPVTPRSSFVSAGGDSLSYVELSLRLEELLGHLPGGWHTTPIRDLNRLAPGRRARRTLETSVALRAVAIVLVVCFHSNALTIIGGAHLLVGVAGFNLARFGLAPVPRADRVRHLLASAARIAVPSSVWVAGVALVAGGYGVANVLHVNALLGSSTWGPTWRLWFIEALLLLVVVIAALSALPWFDRVERRRPFATAAAVVGVGLALPWALPPAAGGPDGIHTAAVLLWLLGLGWAAARATDLWRRSLVSVALLATVPGFFGDPQREAVVTVGMLALVWLTSVPCPQPVRRVAGVLASASLYIYLTHWQVYPLLEVDHPWLAVLASLAVGIAVWQVVERLIALLGRVRHA